MLVSKKKNKLQELQKQTKKLTKNIRGVGVWQTAIPDRHSCVQRFKRASFIILKLAKFNLAQKTYYKNLA